MPTRRVTITAAHGAHARPVAELVRLALEHSAPVSITTAGGAVVDLSSVLEVMELGLTEGDEIVLGTAPSPHAESVLHEMAKVLDPKG